MSLTRALRFTTRARREFALAGVEEWLTEGHRGCRANPGCGRNKELRCNPETFIACISYLPVHGTHRYLQATPLKRDGRLVAMRRGLPATRLADEYHVRKPVEIDDEIFCGAVRISTYDRVDATLLGGVPRHERMQQRLVEIRIPAIVPPEVDNDPCRPALGEDVSETAPERLDACR
jgi:hypothetical protein